MTCSYVSHYKGNYYPLGFCLWVNSGNGPQVSACYCSSGHSCGSAPTGVNASVEMPKACSVNNARMVHDIEVALEVIDSCAECIENGEPPEEAARRIRERVQRARECQELLKRSHPYVREAEAVHVESPKSASKPKKRRKAATAAKAKRKTDKASRKTKAKVKSKPAKKAGKKKAAKKKRK